MTKRDVISRFSKLSMDGDTLLKVGFTKKAIARTV